MRSFVRMGCLWLACLAALGCGVPEVRPVPPDSGALHGGRVPLTPQPISWPLTGGLDTDTGPLSVVPGSHLELADVVQERHDEWRARHGFTVDAQDTLPNGIAPLIGKLGDAGMFALNDQQATYQPSLSSNRWTVPPIIPSGIQIADDITRTPVMSTDNPIVGFAQSGNLYIVASLDSGGPAVAVFDQQGKTHAKIILPTSTYIRARCAATATSLVAYLADGAGNLVTYVVNVATGVVTGPTTIKTGIHATAPYLDSMWDGSSATITVVVRLAAGDAVRFMEHNPATGALATDVSLAGIVANSALSLFQDQGASGVRFVGTADTTGPTVRVLRVSPAGAISTNTLVDSTMAATAITGVGYTSSGNSWTAVYIGTTTSAPLRVARLVAGVGGAGAATSVNGAYRVKITLDGQAWSHDGVTMQFLTGHHSVSTTDPQDSWVMAAIPLNGSGLSNIAVYRLSRICPLQAQEYMLGSTSMQSALFQRIGTGSDVSKFALPVLASYNLVAGVASRQYSIDVFTQQVQSAADIGITVNKGGPVQYKQTSFVPANSASFVDEGTLVPIGTAVPPPQPNLTASTAGGSLTLLATYGYIYVIELTDSDGNSWRSPPSVPRTITLTGTQNTISLSDVMSIGISALVPFQSGSLRVYRTDANGSVYKLAYSFSLAARGADSLNAVIADTLADTAIDGSEVLYTTGELATAITPRFSHMATFGDRLWGVNADFRTELWPSKNLRPGRQPEFVEEGVVDIDDNYGDLTGVIGLDGNGIAFKRNAIYAIVGDGLTDAGSGQAHTYQQVSTDIGAIPGSPLVTAGDRIFFVSDRGIYSIDRGMNVSYVGAGVDKFFNQPLISARETVYDGVFVPTLNEVRFVTTNYVLVYNMKHAVAATAASASSGSYWTRWSLAGFKRCLLINDRMVLFKSDGTVWREGDDTVTTDNGTPYNGIIRSAWVRPTAFGQIRLYRGLALGTRTPGGSGIAPTMQIYEDNSDTVVQSFSPDTGIAGSQSVVQAEARPQQQNCSTFSLQVTLPPSDVTFRLAKWGAEIGVRGGRAQKRPAGESWK